MATFKSAAAYTAILEHVTERQGQAYLDWITERAPDLLARLPEVRRNDEVGSPAVFDYPPHGRFSPTTLRYVKVFAELRALFGDLDGMEVGEIGGGYGGQAFVASLLSAPRRWTIIDLPETAALQGAYLMRHGVRGVDTFSEIADREYDLVVSNYAFSECFRPVQEEYVERMLQRSARGYLTCNWLGRDGRMTLDDLLAALPGARVSQEEPSTAPDNVLVTWGADQCPTAIQ